MARKITKTEFENRSAAILRGVEIQVPPGGIAEKLLRSYEADTPLVVKLGVDPTAPDLHLGHGVVLEKLRQFQEDGHTIVLIIGDATARIGDPTGRNATRPPLSDSEIEKNAQTYLEQVGKFLDVGKLTVRRNSEWLDALDFSAIIRELSKITVGQMLQRRDFSERMKNSTPISMHELVYPVLQGYDSVAISADIEIGGSDQLFNNQVGRWLQESRHLPTQAVLCMPLLVGLDGQDKMSKSKGNYIAVSDNSFEMYGKIMSISDELLPSYLELVSGYAVAKINEQIMALEANSCNPMHVKKALAYAIVVRFHGVGSAQAAEEHFVNNFQRRGEARRYDDRFLDWADSEIGIVPLCEVLDPTRSRGEIRRLIASGAVEVGGATIQDIHQMIKISEGLQIRIGKRGFYSITRRS